MHLLTFGDDSMKTVKIIIAYMVIAVLCIAQVSYAAESTDQAPQFDVPGSVKIEKDNDLTAAMLSNLFGPVWKIVAGDKAADSLGGIGKFSGVVTMCLNFLNTIAMLFVSTGVMYYWVIFAVNTAHHGKIFGKETSIWIPLRHVTSFSLCVPVANGFSLLQIIVLCATSFSINAANRIWDASGAYIIEHSQQGIIDNTPPFIEEESLSLVTPLFKAAVIQQVADKLLVIKEQNLPSKVTNIKNYVKIELSKNGLYSLIYEPLNGAVAICPQPPDNMNMGALGCIHIPAYKFQIEKGMLKMPTEPREKAIYDAQIGITKARVDAVVEMFHELHKHASEYLEAYGVIAKGTAVKGNGDAIYLSRMYRENVMNAAESHVQSLKDKNNVKKMLEIAVDSKDGSSRIGWATAGLFSYNLAQAQAQIDEITFGGSASYLAPPKEYKHNNAHPIEQAAIDNAANYAARELMQHRIYNPVSEEGDGPSTVNKLITGVFIGGNAMSNGILSSTLSAFRQSDPIVVLTSFGRKCYEIGALAAVASMVGAAGSWIPVIGSAMNEVATNPFLVSGMIVLFSVGCVLTFVAPFSIFAIWCWAIAKWILTVFAALLAAPFWAFMHMTPEGEGFTSNGSRKGYVMLVSLMVRPVIMTIGAVCAIGLWQASSILYSTLLAHFLNGFTANAGKGVVVELILSVVVMMVYYWIYYQIFKFCISDAHDVIMNWIGQGGASIFKDDGSAGAAITASASAAVGKGAGLAASGAAAVGGLASSGAQTVGNTAKDLFGKKGKGGGGDDIANIAPKE